MPTSRLEAFSDGVLAIIITIMVLELRPPEGESFADLADRSISFLTYLLSFVYIGIYWSNHHHLFQLVRRGHGRAPRGHPPPPLWLSPYPLPTGREGGTRPAAPP